MAQSLRFHCDAGARHEYAQVGLRGLLARVPRGVRVGGVLPETKSRNRRKLGRMLESTGEAVTRRNQAPSRALMDVRCLIHPGYLH